MTRHENNGQPPGRDLPEARFFDPSLDNSEAWSDRPPPAEGARMRFDQLTAALQSRPNVTLGTGFGPSPAVRVGEKIFAMLIAARLVVKLPKPRVDELVASGVGTPLQMGPTRVMKEWINISIEHAEMWEQLAAEALEFVAAQLGRKKAPR